MSIKKVVTVAVSLAVLALSAMITVGCIEDDDNPLIPSINYGSFTDPRDGKSYRTVVIGSQVWMAENLNYQTDDSWCYDDDPSNCARYGRLYTWSAAMNGASSSSSNPSGVQGVCPAGWHLPSDAEWHVLIKHIDPTHTSWGSHATAGSKLKSQTGWNTYSGISSTDEYGFSALPGGRRHYDSGSFEYVGNNGYWWSATEHDAVFARRWLVDYSNDVMSSDVMDTKAHAFSVRCLRN